MNANYFERQIAHHEKAARGFRVAANQARANGNREQGAIAALMAHNEDLDAARFRMRLARI